MVIEALVDVSMSACKDASCDRCQQLCKGQL